MSTKEENRALATLRLLALKGQGQEVVWLESYDADCYVNDCAYKKMLDPFFGVYPVAMHEYPNLPRAIPREEYRQATGDYPHYICHGCKIRLTEHP